MTDPLLIFVAGFVCCGTLITLYLLYQLMQILREFLALLMEEVKNS